MRIAICLLLTITTLVVQEGKSLGDFIVTPGPSQSINVLPFGGLTDVRYQQIYSSSLFTNAGVTSPVAITALRFSPDVNGVYGAGINLRLNQTTHGVGGLSMNLDQNATGPFVTVLNNPNFSQSVIGGDLTYTLRLGFDANPFIYDPTTGQNLLMDVLVTNKLGGFAFYRGGDTGLTARASSDTSDGLGLRTLIEYQAVPEPSSVALLAVSFLACGLRKSRSHRS